MGALYADGSWNGAAQAPLHMLLPPISQITTSSLSRRYDGSCGAVGLWWVEIVSVAIKKQEGQRHASTTIFFVGNIPRRIFLGDFHVCGARNFIFAPNQQVLLDPSMVYIPVRTDCCWLFNAGGLTRLPSSFTRHYHCACDCPSHLSADGCGFICMNPQLSRLLCLRFPPPLPPHANRSVKIVPVRTNFTQFPRGSGARGGESGRATRNRQPQRAP